jgi:hypothetical protein
MKRIWTLTAVLAFGGALAAAEPYSVNWEGDDWPENQAWTRVWGNWDGLYHGPGAYRTLENGILTYDSMYDAGVCDFSRMSRNGPMDPGPGEVFVAEWRLKVDQVAGQTDPTVAISSDDAWSLGLEFGYDRIYSGFEHELEIPFEPGVFHSYRVTSPDMVDYALYIDDRLARQGRFVHLVGPPEIGWGDGVQGAASVHEWDYFRFGVIPEPSTVQLLMGFAVWCVARRR